MPGDPHTSSSSQTKTEGRVCEMHMPRLMHFLFAHDLLGAHSDVEVSRWVYGSW